jgi:hypothetical protein
MAHDDDTRTDLPRVDLPRAGIDDTQRFPVVPPRRPDPPGPPGPPPPASPAPTAPADRVHAPRRWPWITAVVLLVLTVGALGWYGFDTREGADQWERTARRWQDRAGSQEDRAVASERAVADLSRKLEASEADVAALESRVTELAAEKAAVGDQRELAEGERDFFREVSELAADAANQLSNCVSEQSYLYGLLIDAGPSSDLNRIAGIADTVDEVCTDAYAAVDVLDAALSASGP